LKNNSLSLLSGSWRGNGLCWGATYQQ